MALILTGSFFWINMLKLIAVLILLIPLTLSAAPDPKTKFCWTPPTLNSNGSPLTDLAGFRIFLGSVSGQYTITADVPDPLKVCETFVILNVPDGSFYAAMAAYNVNNDDSEVTQEIGPFLFLNGLVHAVVPAVPSNFNIQ